jgi:hypothetical protein
MNDRIQPCDDCGEAHDMLSSCDPLARIFKLEEKLNQTKAERECLRLSRSAFQGDCKDLETQLQKAKDLIHHAADENERLKAELGSAILLLKKSTGFVCGSLLQEPIQDFIKRNTPLPTPKKEGI